MVYTTLGQILIALWDPLIIVRGTIDHNDSTPFNELFKGVTYSDDILGLGELGFSRELADNMKGDIYVLNVVGTTRSEVNLQIKALQKIAITFRGEITDIYRKLYLQDLERMDFRPEQQYSREGEWRVAKITLLGSRVGESNVG